ncbi:MAG: DUF429 domain-containing protein [Rubrobacteraceae bacterium]|uniref:hypothetical protein n=1 Tax=Rubrobacter naiadicus TaxID=1392641 RepID=UPI003849A0C4|nr:DUF429 domain-containing protein [Rubrobacteraceae bacterium]MCL6438105.1 DUF429 domain-containing protein [Rubrobacteraceae bacterium]
MRFVGCALAWRPGEADKKVSALSVLDERGNIIANTFCGTVEEIADAVEGYDAGHGEIIVGVDAPLAVPNERGTRRVERLLSRLSLPAYSASRKIFDGRPRSEELLAALEKVGIEYTDYPFRRERDQSVVVEVDSAATLKVLSLERKGISQNGDLSRRLEEMREPRLRKGNKKARAEAIKDAIDVLWNTPGLRLRTGNLSADLHSPENVDLSKLEVNEELSHAELDRIVALIEATLAAYTVYRHWKGRDGSLVLGSGDAGAVLIPASGALREWIFRECRAAGMPCA